MDLIELRQNITSLIDDVKVHSDALTGREKLPVVQLKIILAKLNTLTEKTTILKHYVEMEESASAEIKDTTPTPEPTPAPEPVEEKTQETPIVETQSEIPIEKTMTKTAVGLVEDKLKKMLVNDLFAAIGINEKYFYASQLFSGNIAHYTESLHRLNDADSLGNAKKIITELSGSHRWDPEDETVKNFIELVERKFGQP